MTFPDEGSGMKRDSEVLLMRRERAKGRTQEQAAARAGMSLRYLEYAERYPARPGGTRPGQAIPGPARRYRAAPARRVTRAGL